MKVPIYRLWLIIGLLLLGSNLSLAKPKTFYHPRYGFTLIIPYDWELTMGPSEEGLVFLRHKLGATIYVQTNPVPLRILSEEDLKKRWLPLFEQRLRQDLENFELKKKDVQYQKGVWHCVLLFRGKPKEASQTFYGRYDIHIFWEKGFGQRFLALVQAAPEELWKRKDLQGVLSAVRKGFQLPPHSPSFVYWKKKNWEWWVIGLCVGVLLGIFVRVWQRNRQISSQEKDEMAGDEKSGHE